MSPGEGVEWESVVETASRLRDLLGNADTRSFSSAPHFGREFQKELNTLSRFAGGVLLRC
jgi:hypothetical protein